MSNVLVLDVTRLLDESATGQAAAKKLQARFDELAKERAGVPAAEHPAFDAKAGGELEKERARLRSELLQQAQPRVEKILETRGAEVVLHAAAVVAYADSVDITDELLKGL